MRLAEEITYDVHGFRSFLVKIKLGSKTVQLFKQEADQITKERQRK